MKRRHLLYAIGIMAVVGILAGVVGYTLPTQEPVQQTLAEMTGPDKTTTTTEVTDTTTVTVKKKKGCGCCAERRARLEKRKQQAQARKLARDQATKIVSP